MTSNNSENIKFNIKGFHKSFTEELQAVKNRVRNLISDAHWGEEGRYKEIVFRNIVSRFLPSNFDIGTGFIITNKGKPSSQIDVIVYDNTYPVLFKQGDFVIVSADSVRVLIEIKTKIDNYSALKPILLKASKNNELVQNSMRVFNGVFIYDSEFSLNNETNEKKLIEIFDSKKEDNCKGVDFVTLGQNKFIRTQPPLYNILEAFEFGEHDKFAFTYFLGNMLLKISYQQSSQIHKLLFPYESKYPFRVFYYNYNDPNDL